MFEPRRPFVRLHSSEQPIPRASVADDSADRDDWAAIHIELRAMAASALRAERDTHTLQPTALAHEAYFRLVGIDSFDWQNPIHFRSAAATVIRHVLVDHARTRASLRRAGGATPCAKSSAGSSSRSAKGHVRDEDLLDLNEALTELAGLNERLARIIELRFFGGLTTMEIGDLVGLSVRAVELEWSMARAWLRDRLSA